MKVVLELQDQQSNIKKVTVRHDIVIGRGADCNLRLSAPQVSRRHCFLRISEEGAFVSDMDSSNGTFLDGNKLTSGKRYELKDGANFAVGPVKFTAHVRSEVLAGESLQVAVADDRIEAEEVVEQQEEKDDYLATIAHPLDDGAMDFAVEHVGPSASEDDPTADYVAAGTGTPGLFAAGDGEPTGGHVTDEQNEETTVADGEAVAEVFAEQSGLLSTEDDEMLVIDDDDEIPSADSLEEVPAKPDGDDDERELRDFLSGLE